MRDPTFMLIPVGEDAAVPVTIVLLSPEPEILQATLRRLEQDALLLELPAGTPAPEIGARLIVNAAERTKLTGRVLEVHGAFWTVSRDRMHATDDRAAPRVRSKIHLRWRHADAGEAAWLAGEPDESEFVRFSGGGDLSLAGVRFDLAHVASAPLPALGDRLFVELSLSGDAHRVLGIVRRVETGEQPSVAVEFIEVPEATFDALSDFTLNHL